MNYYPTRRGNWALSMLAFAWAMAAAVPATAGPALRETTDFADVASAVQRYAEDYGGENVLLACDLDNTLLAMEQDLGSDQWFEWQSHLLAADPRSPQLVARDFPGLLRAQGVLFDLQPMRLTQPDLPLLVGRLQGLGVRTIVLTARGEEFRGATEFELRRNGLSFADHALTLSADERGSEAATTETFLPYDRHALKRAGISELEFKAWGLRDTPAEVSYGAGVYMVAGQHKGAMLAALLTRAEQSVRAVVYVDQDRQVRRVFDALLNRGYQATVFDYQREQARVKAFQYGGKAAVTRQWRRLERLLYGAPGRQPERALLAPPK